MSWYGSLVRVQASPQAAAVVLLAVVAGPFRGQRRSTGTRLARPDYPGLRNHREQLSGDYWPTYEAITGNRGQTPISKKSGSDPDFQLAVRRSKTALVSRDGSASSSRLSRSAKR